MGCTGENTGNRDTTGMPTGRRKRDPAYRPAPWWQDGWSGREAPVKRTWPQGSSTSPALGWRGWTVSTNGGAIRKMTATLHLLPPPAPTATQEFEDFWKAYPRRQDKGDARRAWYETHRIRPPMADLLAAIEAQKLTDQWARGFIPNPAKWLRNEAWANETLDPADLERAAADAKRAARDRAQAAWESLTPEQKLAEIARRRAAQ